MNGQGSSVATSLLGAGVLPSRKPTSDQMGSWRRSPAWMRTKPASSPATAYSKCSTAGSPSLAGPTNTVRALLAVAGAANLDEVPRALAPRNAAVVLADLASAGVPSDVVARAQRDTFFDAPANRAAGLVTSYHSVEYGRIEQPGAMWYFGDLDVRLELAPPALGQHTIEALTSVGVDIEELRLLIAHGAARQG